MKRYIFIAVALLVFTAVVEAVQVNASKSKLTPSDSEFHILYPDVALNTATGETLMVWTRYFTHLVPPEGRSPIAGRILNAKGVAITPELELTANPKAYFCSVAYNPIVNEYLLVYDNNPDGASVTPTTIFAQRIATNGQLIGSPLDLTAKDPVRKDIHNQFPKVIFNPRTGGYTAIWIGGAAQLTADGKLNGPLFDLVVGGILNDFAAFPSGSKLLTLGHRIDRDSSGVNGADYLLTAVNPLVKSKSQPPSVQLNETLVNLEGYWGWSGSFVFPSENEGIVFYSDNTGIMGQKLDSSGKPTGAPYRAFKSPMSNMPLLWPSAAFAQTPAGLRGVLVAMEDAAPVGGMSIWTQFLNEKGLPIGTPVKVYSGNDAQTAINGATVSLPGTPGSSVSNFLWTGVLSNNRNNHPYGLSDFVMKVKLSINP